MGSLNVGFIFLFLMIWIMIFREGIVWGIVFCGFCLGDGVGGSNWLRVLGFWVLNLMLMFLNFGLMLFC